MSMCKSHLGIDSATHVRSVYASSDGGAGERDLSLEMRQNYNTPAIREDAHRSLISACSICVRHFATHLVIEDAGAHIVVVYTI